MPQSLLEFFAQHHRLCFSQLGQDLFALYANPGRNTGFFLDIGAYDGISISNTYLLEKLGWSGVCIEPNPAMFAKLKTFRTCDLVNKCLSDSGGEIDFYVDEGNPEYSSSDLARSSEHANFRASVQQAKKIKVQAIDFAALEAECQIPDEIDFVSIDTEGTELDIVRNIPLERKSVGVFAIEHNYRPDRDDICNYLKGRGYIRLSTPFSLFDDWYVSEARWTAMQASSDIASFDLDIGAMPKAEEVRHFYARLSRISLLARRHAHVMTLYREHRGSEMESSALGINAYRSLLSRKKPDRAEEVLAQLNARFRGDFHVEMINVGRIKRESGPEGAIEYLEQLEQELGEMPLFGDYVELLIATGKTKRLAAMLARQTPGVDAETDAIIHRAEQFVIAQNAEEAGPISSARRNDFPV